MSMPFYVSPDQMMQDRADFARKGIARGRSVIAARCADGIALVAENPSVSLHKISEIYDRIGFAAVGRYNEFEALRVQGIRYADLRGYAYDRADAGEDLVTGEPGALRLKGRREGGWHGVARSGSAGGRGWHWADWVGHDGSFEMCEVPH